MGKITITFLERLGIRCNDDAALKLTGELIFSLDKKKKFSTPVSILCRQVALLGVVVIITVLFFFYAVVIYLFDFYFIWPRIPQLPMEK